MAVEIVDRVALEVDDLTESELAHTEGHPKAGVVSFLPGRVSAGSTREEREMGKTVQDAMTRDPRTATPSQSLTEAAQMMKSENAGALPVVQDGRLVGILTDRDIVMRAVAEGIDPRVLTVGDVASRPVVAITPSQDLDDALAMMAQYQLRRLPVVEWDDVVVGILAQADVALNVKEKRAGETLEEISKPEAATAWQ